MSKFDFICNKMPDKYLNDYNDLFDESRDQKYIKKKILDDSLSLDQFIQGASEAMLYFHFLKQKYKFETDKKVNNDNDTDVDFVVTEQKNTFYIEVKTPDLDEKEDGNIVGYSGIHRYSNDKSFQVRIDDVFEEISQEFKSLGKQVIKFKKDDNKLKDYLESANRKFHISNLNEMNILVICLDTSAMDRFLKYICNGSTGLFVKNSFIPKTSFDKVDCIVLSNCVENQIDPKFNFKYWEMSNFINFIIPINREKNEEITKQLIKMFDDQFAIFANYANNYDGIKGESRINEELAFSAFVAEKWAFFNMNTNKRQY